MEQTDTPEAAHAPAEHVDEKSDAPPMNQTNRALLSRLSFLFSLILSAILGASVVLATLYFSLPVRQMLLDDTHVADTSGVEALLRALEKEQNQTLTTLLDQEKRLKALEDISSQGGAPDAEEAKRILEESIRNVEESKRQLDEINQRFELSQQQLTPTQNTSSNDQDRVLKFLMLERARAAVFSKDEQDMALYKQFFGLEELPNVLPALALSLRADATDSLRADATDSFRPDGADSPSFAYQFSQFFSQFVVVTPLPSVELRALQSALSSGSFLEIEEAYAVLSDSEKADIAFEEPLTQRRQWLEALSRIEARP